MLHAGGNHMLDRITKREGPCLGVDDVLVANVDVCGQDLAQHNDLLLAAAGHAVHEAVQQLDGGLEVELLAILRAQVGDGDLQGC